MYRFVIRAFNFQEQDLVIIEVLAETEKDALQKARQLVDRNNYKVIEIRLK